MLERLYIKNFALIDDLEIKFASGFTVMTGETGAGKTMIVEALNLICGERANQDVIRMNCDTAVIEAEFSLIKNKKISEILNQFSISFDEDILIIRRELNVSGKNKCIVNGNQITLSMLKQLGDYLVDIHGQHEHQSLLSSMSHLELLDSFAGLNPDIADFSELYHKYKNLEEKISDLQTKKNERANKIDFFEFQIKEINDMALIPQEDEELQKQALILRNAEKLSASIGKAYNLLHENENAPSILEQLERIKQEFAGLITIDESLKEYLGLCENTLIELKELGNNVFRYKNSLEFNPDLQIKIEERLSAIQRLKKKYGNSITEILAYCQKTQKELDELRNEEENFANYQDDLILIKNELAKKASCISQKRTEAGILLNTKVEKELQDLGMSKCKFLVKIYKEESSPGDIILDNKSYRLFSWGVDKVEFFISPNPGEEPKPLIKIASGGEISRIMLSLKTISTKEDSIPTVVFDEIDAGVGGAIASKVGKKIKSISLKFQVIAITHLPQIASLADNHCFISKKIKKDQTKTDVKLLNKDERINEIARMLSGERITDVTLKHAQEMIKSAENLR